jgi:acyl dehydratase
MNPPRTIAFDNLSSLAGERLGSSDWIEITQEMVDAFADVTGDRQWIHCDPQRAHCESPYGTTVGHGFLTLSLGPMLAGQIFALAGARLTINYGLNRVRFPSPAPVGSRLRMHVDLLEVSELADGFQVIFKETFEIEGQHKPACVAEAVVRFLRSRAT